MRFCARDLCQRDVLILEDANQSRRPTPIDQRRDTRWSSDRFVTVNARRTLLRRLRREETRTYLEAHRIR
jgi:hypothetical protein